MTKQQPFTVITELKGKNTIPLIEYDYNHKTFKNKRLTLNDIVETLNNQWNKIGELQDTLNKIGELAIGDDYYD